MDIEIKKLSPDLVDDYLHFFDVTPHDDDLEGHKCYCVCWCSADHSIPTDFSSREKRRQLARQYVIGGEIQGYLAYSNGDVVGWCNANTKSDCEKCISWLRSMQNIEVDKRDLKVKSIFCFVITPQLQRQGLATMLLKRVCDDAKMDGFDIVESYPNKGFINVVHDFMGPAAMYEKLGFTVYGQNDKDRLVMRKQLK